MNIISKIKEKGIIRCILYAIITPFYLLIKYIMLKSIDIKENYVLFYSKPDFSDNCKALYNYLNTCKNHKNNLKFIWLTDKKVKLKLKNTKFIMSKSKYHKGLTIRAIYYVMKSKNIFFTHSSPIKGLAVNKKQNVINLWHGCGYKAVEKKNWIKSNYFDYVLVPGDIFIDAKSKFFSCRKDQILPIGYPRYDWLKQDNIKSKQYIELLKKENQKIIIWMPTFRKTKNGNYPEEKMYDNLYLPLFNTISEIKRLDDICRKNKVVLCIKRHMFQLEYSYEKEEFTNIVFITNENLKKEDIELYSLLRYTDGLITDYSSIAIDYLLLDKPIGFVLSDFNEYSSSRGFVFDKPLEFMPGHHIYDSNDFINYIEDIVNNVDKHKENRSKIIKKVHNMSDNYCEKIINTINNMEGNL